MTDDVERSSLLKGLSVCKKDSDLLWDVLKKMHYLYCILPNEIKRRLLPGRKVMTNLDSILKSRDITLQRKVCLVKTMVFPVVMYGCESWAVKKTEHRRIDAFELWCWRTLLRVSWTARRSNQSILKEISPEYSCWSWNSSTLAIWCEELTHWKRPWCWKRWRWEKGMTEDEMVGWHHRPKGSEFE